MKTAKQREESFRKDFEELLERHEAEYEVDPDTGPTITMWSKRDVIRGVAIEEYCEFTL